MPPGILARNARWLLTPPIVLCTLDFGLTAYGQPDGYWAGNYAVVNEVSPAFARCLSLHPSAFFAAVLLWIIVFSVLIVLLPESFALTLAIAIVIGHMAGAASWLLYEFQSYPSCNLLFLATSGLVVFAFKRGQNTDGRSALNWERSGLPEWSRWLAIAALAALPVSWFLIPQ